MFLRLVAQYAKAMAILAPLLVICWFAAQMWPSQTTLLKNIFVVALVWRFWQMEIDRIVAELSNPDRFREYINSRLYSGAYWRQYRALQRLSVLVGCRFGIPVFPPRKVRRSVELWRCWWEANASRLTWEPLIGKYVEADYLVNADAKRSVA